MRQEMRSENQGGHSSPRYSEERNYFLGYSTNIGYLTFLRMMISITPCGGNKGICRYLGATFKRFV